MTKIEIVNLVFGLFAGMLIVYAGCAFIELDYRILLHSEGCRFLILMGAVLGAGVGSVWNIKKYK